MKIRNGFVSNSSSTAFIITNKTNDELDLVDFVTENPQFVDMWDNDYGFEVQCQGGKEKLSHEILKQSAKDNNIKLKPGDQRVAFGDSDGTVIGEVFDYILRDGGSSERFSWEFHEYYR